MSRALAVIMGLALLTGCVGYTTYPPADWQLASDSISGPPADELMTVSLRYVIDRYPPAGGGTIVVNLPEGVNDRAYGVIASRVGGDVVPMARGLEGLPTYHVTRIWVRGTKAEVDVLRPVGELGASPTGRPIIQAMTVRLEGGVREWHVVRTRPWVIGEEEVPSPHYYGEESEGSPDGGAPDGGVDLDS
ncbi:MAG: hypothetical protein H6810_05535 [Phycisphaeraceae bacterium]|nr:MAG: hypothetical protein H6810_05535 [Phycisphaeraceae bacterium]